MRPITFLPVRRSHLLFCRVFPFLARRTPLHSPFLPFPPFRNFSRGMSLLCALPSLDVLNVSHRITKRFASRSPSFSFPPIFFTPVRALSYYPLGAFFPLLSLLFLYLRFLPISLSFREFPPENLELFFMCLLFSLSCPLSSFFHGHVPSLFYCFWLVFSCPRVAKASALSFSSLFTPPLLLYFSRSQSLF